MTRYLLFAFSIVIIASNVLIAQEEKKAHPQASVETAITHAITILEAKKYKELLDQYVPPADLAKMKEAGAYELVVKKFGEGEKSGKLLNALKAAQTVKPEYNEDKTSVVFNFTKEVDGEQVEQRPVRFTKIGKLWYIGN
ncbi:MAG: hypothetical protein P8M30_00610 [Planctomycetaceae bacterium]|jgi:hypothetical protein|nr:hypothetical protein [bacterium]MDC0274278.1 hypothetical protein [Planctomycetaceae bacterium]MDG2387794.1 hypothetical protein [Planctomycetaceae bacterium]